MAVTRYGRDRKDVSPFFNPTNDTNGNIFYTINNWDSIYIHHNQNLSNIHSKGGAVWLNASGDICYRLSYYGKIHTVTPEKASMVISNFLHDNIYIRHTFRQISKSIGAIYNDSSKRIPIVNLVLIEDEKFDFMQPLEFYKDQNGLIYRNTFKPSVYLMQQPSQEHHFMPSIILQYIYYLSSYNESRFYYILDWLAGFFKNFNYRITTPLILIGKKESGKDILFDEIIKPLFGHEYCVTITDDHFRLNNLSATFKNKLFYHLDDTITNISNHTKAKKSLTDMITKQKVYIEENKSSISKIDIFGQILITVSEPDIPYLDKEKINFIAFKVPDDLEKIFLPENMIFNNLVENDNFKTHFINLISNDLSNFANILKGHTIKESSINDFTKNGADDKNLILQSTDDKLKAFSDAVVDSDTAYFSKIQNIAPDLYNEIMQDLKDKKIKQSNLIKCFNTIYEEEKILSPRTLMTMLRKINNSFFCKDALKVGTAGVKYFPIK